MNGIIVILGLIGACHATGWDIGGHGFSSIGGDSFDGGHDGGFEIGETGDLDTEIGLGGFEGHGYGGHEYGGHEYGGHGSNYVPVVKNIAVPVQKPFAIPVKVPEVQTVAQPYPLINPVLQKVPLQVEKLEFVRVEKKIPYPVEKIRFVRIEKPVPIPVIKPVPVPIEKHIPIKIPIYKTIVHKAKKHY